MPEFLETVMLICFGFSWPMSLIKNLRAKSAKSTSLAFMLLVIVGYTAGIVAKAMTAGFNYVFFVYVFNIVMVLANLAVTLHNRAAEKRNAAPASGDSAAQPLAPKKPHGHEAARLHSL